MFLGVINCHFPHGFSTTYKEVAKNLESLYNYWVEHGGHPHVIFDEGSWK